MSGFVIALAPILMLAVGLLIATIVSICLDW